MANLTNITADVVNSATGGDARGTNLDDFLTQFSPNDGKWIQTLDPLVTFDLRMKFFPTIEALEEERGIGKKVLGALKSIGQSATKNALNSATGGLLGSFLNRNNSILDRRKDFLENTDYKHTFMEYLASANLLVGKDDWFGESSGESVKGPLELQLGLYVAEVQINKLSVGFGGKAEGLIGTYNVNDSLLSPEGNELQITFLNTKVPLIDRIFYPWMRELTLPYWVYDTQPYTTATITIDFSKHSDVQYVFTGCRPASIELIQPDQSGVGKTSRLVTFKFDCMFIESKLRVMESVKDKLLSTGASLFNGGAGLIGG